MFKENNKVVNDVSVVFIVNSEHIPHLRISIVVCEQVNVCQVANLDRYKNRLNGFYFKNSTEN